VARELAEVAGGFAVRPHSEREYAVVRAGGFTTTAGVRNKLLVPSRRARIDAATLTSGWNDCFYCR
jgi:hypothetical protein